MLNLYETNKNKLSKTFKKGKTTDIDLGLKHLESRRNNRRFHSMLIEGVFEKPTKVTVANLRSGKVVMYVYSKLYLLNNFMPISVERFKLTYSTDDVITEDLKYILRGYLNEDWVQSSSSIGKSLDKNKFRDRLLALPETLLSKIDIVRSFINLSPNSEEAKDLALTIITRNFSSSDYLKSRKSDKSYEISKDDITILKKLGYLSFFHQMDNLFKIYKDELKNNVVSEAIGIVTENLKDQERLKKYSKKDADEFAKKMGSHIEKAKSKGNITVRQIADYLNENDIKSAFGKKWSIGAVSTLLKRRYKLGFQDFDKIHSDQEDEYVENILQKLKRVQKEGYTSTRKIAEKFNELGLKTKRGADWSHVSVYNFINKYENTVSDENSNSPNLD